MNEKFSIYNKINLILELFNINNITDLKISDYNNNNDNHNETSRKS